LTVGGGGESGGSLAGGSIIGRSIAGHLIIGGSITGGLGAGVGDAVWNRGCGSWSWSWFVIISCREGSSSSRMDRLITVLTIELMVFSSYILNALLPIYRGVYIIISRLGVATGSCSDSPDSSESGETVGWRSGAFPLALFGAIVLINRLYRLNWGFWLTA
jgi:hypothetical protein